MSDNASNIASGPVSRALLRSALLLHVVAALVYLLAAWLSLTLGRAAEGLAGIWFANAVAVAFFDLAPRRYWLSLGAAILVGGVAAATATAGEWRWLNLGLAVASVIEILAAATLLRFVHLRHSPSLPRAGALLLLTCVGAPAIGATLGGLLSSAADASPFWFMALRWWTADTAGFIMALPFVISLVRQAGGIGSGFTLLELTALVLLSLLVSYLALRYLKYPFIYVELPLLWAALRFGPLLTAGIALINIAFMLAWGWWPGGANSLEASWLDAQLFNLSASLIMVVPFALSVVMAELRRDRAELLRSEAQFRDALDYSAIGMALVSPEGRWLRVNRAICDIVGYSERELLQLTFQDITHPDDLNADVEQVQQMLRGEIETYRMEKRYIRKDGREVWILLAASLLRDERGEPLYFISQIEDIDRRKRAEAALQEEKERLRITLHSIGDAVICTDQQAVVTFVNPVAETLTGWSAAAALGRPLDEVLHIVEERSGAPARNPVKTCLQEKRVYYLEAGIQLISRSGERYDIQDSAAPVKGEDGTVMGAVLVFQDVTKAREMQRQLRHQAQHDPLTGLPNRREFERRLRELLQTDDQRAQALCYIDLDRFKQVNDEGGHQAGDALLRELSAQLASVVRDSDTLARLGGDEFGLLLPNCPPERAKVIADNLVQAVEAFSFPWEGHRYEVGASIGIVPFDSRSGRVAELMERADKACYRAKTAGRGRAVVYRAEADEQAVTQNRRQLLSELGLRQALADSRFELYAQPVRSLDAINHVEALEILLRLRSDGELLLPGAFLPVAERYHLGPELDRWMLEQVLVHRGADLSEGHSFKVAVNLSIDTLLQDSFFAFLEGLLRQSPLRAERLMIEIAEYAIARRLNEAAIAMQRLQTTGCELVLDDFAGGPAALRYVQSLPVRQLKLDGALARTIEDSAANSAITAGVVQTALALGYQPIAKCVETLAAADELRALGVRAVQGYAYDRPEPLSKVIDSYQLLNK